VRVSIARPRSRPHAPTSSSPSPSPSISFPQRRSLPHRFLGTMAMCPCGRSSPTDGSMPASANRSLYLIDTYCEPLSLWWTNAFRSDCRAYGACSRASSTKSVRIELLTRQPTIHRAKTSITKAT